MLQVFRIFFINGWRLQALILAAMLIAGLVEVIGIATFWPIIELVNGDGDGANNANALVQRLFGLLGLPVTIPLLLGLILAAAVLKFILATAGSVFVGRCVANFSTALRLDIISALVKARWSYFVAQPAGRFGTAISSDSNRGAAAFKAAGLTLAASIQSLAYLVYLVQSASLAFFAAAIAAIAILWLAAGRYMRMAKKAGRGKSKHNLALLNAVIDALTNAKALKAMNRHTFIGRAFAVHVENLRRAAKAETYSAAAMRAMQDPLLTILVLGGLYIGHSVFALDLAAMMVSALLLARIAESIFTIRFNYQRVLLDRPAFWAVLALLREIRANAETMRRGLMPPPRADITLADIRFDYPGREILRGVDLALKPGELTTLYGSSGAGKTTIADLLVGLHEAKSGRMTVGGEDFSAIDLAAWRRQLGYIPQESILFNDSVLNNVTLSDPAISREQAIAALKAAGAWRFVSALPGEIDFVVGVRGSLLSGGQRQRLSIARALLGEPKLLVLDEATSALDLETARKISRQVQSLKGERTVLAITHQHLWVEAADRVYEIRAGAVAPAAAGK